MVTRYLNFNASANGIGTLGSPWNLFTTAQSGIEPGDTVVVSGKSRASMVLLPAKGGVSPAAKTKWLGTLENPFTISGGEALNGWVQCGPGDVAVLGAEAALKWKVTITKSSLAGPNGFAVNLCEAGKQLPICMERANTADKFFITRAQDYHTADSVTLSVTNITGFRKPSVTDLYTKAQIEASTVYFVGSPNISAESAVSVFDTTTKVISLATPAVYENSLVKDNFALANLLPAMKRGEWGFLDNGTTITIYCYPQNVASLASQMEYTARSVGIDIGGTSNVEIGFFITTQHAVGSRFNGNLINSKGDCSNVHLHNFESTDMINYSTSFAALVYLNLVHDLHMHNFDLVRGQGCFGVYLQGSGSGSAPSVVKMVERPYLHHFTVSYVSSGPMRLFTTGNGAITDGIYWEAAKQSHGNTMNNYESSYNMLWKNIDGEDADGYYTWQESDSIVIMCCSGSASRASNGGARSFFHQQGPFTPQGSFYGYKPSMIFNIRAVPWGLGGRLGSNNALRAGAGAVPNDRWKVYNNIYHGHGAMTTADFATVDDWDYNIITIGTDARGVNDELIPVNTLFNNPALDNFTYPSNSRARTKVGKNMSTIITALQTRFPMVTDWNTDMFGDALNWATPPVGPVVDKDKVFGQARNITYAGIVTNSGGGGGTGRESFGVGFKIKSA